MLTWEKSPWGSFSLWSIGSQPYIQSAIAKGENHRDLGSLRKREHSGHRAAQSDRLDSSPGVTLHYQWLGESPTAWETLFCSPTFCFVFFLLFVLFCKGHCEVSMRESSNTWLAKIDGTHGRGTPSSWELESSFAEVCTSSHTPCSPLGFGRKYIPTNGVTETWSALPIQFSFRRHHTMSIAFLCSSFVVLTVETSSSN